MSYYCYLLADKDLRTYIGITNNLDNRIDQHNGIKSGGAKATKKSNTWNYKCIIECINKQAAGSIEWYWKHKQNTNGKWVRTSGIVERIKHVDHIIKKYAEKIEKHTIYNT